MNSLKNELTNQIPLLQNDIKKLISEKGGEKISEVTVAQAYSGLRGIKAFVCDTSSVSADKGLIIRGIPLLEMTHALPEEVFYLLLTGKLPNDSELKELQEEFSKHLEVPDYVWNVLKEMPESTHPMTMFNAGILSMQSESVFYKNYSKGMPKTEFWEAVLDDGDKVTCKTTLPCSWHLQDAI